MVYIYTCVTEKDYTSKEKMWKTKMIAPINKTDQILPLHCWWEVPLSAEKICFSQAWSCDHSHLPVCLCRTYTDLVRIAFLSVGWVPSYIFVFPPLGFFSSLGNQYLVTINLKMVCVYVYVFSWFLCSCPDYPKSLSATLQFRTCSYLRAINAHIWDFCFEYSKANIPISVS